MMIEVPSDNLSPKSANAFSKWLGRTGLAMMGWQVDGMFLNQKKYIVVLAPHTSNWDFVIAIGVLLASGLKISFLIKHSLFFWPFGVFLRKVGGIPIDRKSAHGVVGEIVTHFNAEEALIVALAPEGTRKAVKQWKTGFLHMASEAQVPILPVAFDYDHKTLRIGSAVVVSGDVEADLSTVKAFYKGIRPKNVQVNDIKAK
ncbi:MAG: 1-acyl-sn-glycerol-3-phosphate acyltransferase [Phenylobacterium sp.]|jgi:1-acyl-sn-glycerol-3-phosphate acyltransferase